MPSGLASPQRNVKAVKILFLRSWAWECLGTRGTISLGAKMQYFFFFGTSVCFSVTWGEQNLPGLLKHRRCGQEAAVNKVPFLKLGRSRRDSLL